LSEEKQILTIPAKTLRQPASLSGIGLHSGARVTVRLCPAPAGTGILFARTDLAGRPTVSARDFESVSAPFRTALKNGAVEVHTVEHILSALFSLGITDCLIEIDGLEVPGMDGSACEFVAAIQQAGIEALKGSGVEPLVVQAPVQLEEGKARIAALPYPGGLKISYKLHYPGEPLAQGCYELELSEDSYAREIAPARTFVPRKEVEAMRAAGLGKGADYQNTVVIEGASAIETALRFADEPVRHKILDLLGDLCLLGRPVHAHIVASCSGHKINRALVMRLRSAGFQPAVSRISNPQAVEAEDRLPAGSRRYSRLEACATTAAGKTPEPQGKATMQLDTNAIQAILPHRYPFLLVDRIIELEAGKRIVGVKNVSANEGFFQGHFPGEPVMPGVLILEALAQVSCVLVLRDLGVPGSIALFTGADSVSWRRKVVPGDQLRLEAEVDKLRVPFGRMKAKATVDGELACEALIKFMIQMPEGK